jgi:hypothetical protein
VLTALFFVLLLGFYPLEKVSAQVSDTTNKGSATSPTGAAGAPKQTRAKRPGFDLPDSLYIALDSVRGDIDTIVYYEAQDSTMFDIMNRKMWLTGDAKLDFRATHLTAHRIVMDFKGNTLSAMSEVYDSVIAKSLEKQRRIIRDTQRVKSRGAPKLVDGTTPYEGELIIYNFKTRQGSVALATSTMEGGFYYGEKIKQVAPQTLFVQNGRYTTCDAPTPHFYFESPKMKILTGDEIFAEPVFLYIADVPIFALPFGVFPNHAGGRHSGIIAPSYSTTSSRGFGLIHLGYYQILSDYADAAFKTDLYTRGGYNITFGAQYMKRYLLTSPIALELGYGKTRFSVDEQYSTDFKMALRMPNLVIDPVTSVSADLSFLSNNYNRNNAQNINDIVNQSINSRASFSTTFEKIDFSLGGSYSRVQNLRDGTYTETSPSLTWGKITPIHPFASSTSTDDQNVLQTFQITYNGSASRSVSKTQQIIAFDSLRAIKADTSYLLKESYNIRHSPGISISPKLGYISLTPSFSYNELWFLRRKTKTAYLNIRQTPGGPDTTVAFNESFENGLYREPSYNYGLAFNTTLYGTANVGLLGIKAVRHTFIPSITFNYTPDLSDRGKAYYFDPKQQKDVQYSIYEDDGGYYGSQKSGHVGFGIGNDFEAKVEHKVNADSSFEEKIKIVNLSLNSGYDLIQKLFSAFSVNAYSQIGNLFSLNGSANFSWYPQNYFGGDSTDKTLIALHEGILRATNLSFSLRGNFTSSEASGGENVDSLYRLFDISSPEDERKMLMGGNYPGRFVSLPFRPKWNLSYGMTYSESYGISTTTRTILGDAALTLSFTKNWSVTTSAQYDFAAHQFVVPNIRIHRDLHCWELNFDYRPTGDIKGFNLEVRIKAEALRDIKLSRQESTYGTF